MQTTLSYTDQLAGVARLVRDVKESVVALHRRNEAHKPLSARDRVVRHIVLRACSSPTMTPEAVYLQRYRGKAATDIAQTTVPAWAGYLAASDVVAFLAEAPVPSVAVQLAALGTSVSFTEAVASVPYRLSGQASGGWVKQGAPIKVVAAQLGAALLEHRKLASISGFSGELRRLPTPDVEAIIAAILGADLRIILDRTLLDDQPASDTRPAGVRHGVTPIAGSGDMQADLTALVADLVAKGATRPVLIAGTVQAVPFAFLPGTLTIPVLSTPELEAGVVVAVDATSFISAMDRPLVDSSDEALLSMRDDPAPISEGGVVTTPTRSLWQTDSIAVRIVLDADFTVAGGRTSWLEGVAW